MGWGVKYSKFSSESLLPDSIGSGLIGDVYKETHVRKC
jgi:hypothetical protein